MPVQQAPCLVSHHRSTHTHANTSFPPVSPPTSPQLDYAQKIVQDYKAGREDPALTSEQVWAAKELYDSAFHPQTGEKLFLPGRMSFQVPGNMFITGCMLTFYRSVPAIVFWQTANQGFNALANYTNR